MLEGFKRLSSTNDAPIIDYEIRYTCDALSVHLALIGKHFILKLIRGQ